MPLVGPCSRNGCTVQVKPIGGQAGGTTGWHAGVMVVSSFHYLLAPSVAVAALVIVCLLCRWTFSTTHRDDRASERLAKLRSAGDYGLLESIAEVTEPEDADLLVEVLGGAGIRATIAPSTKGLSVLVFRTDASRARDLVNS